jgi:hypothetical protein
MTTLNGSIMTQSSHLIVFSSYKQWSTPDETCVFTALLES